MAKREKPRSDGLQKYLEIAGVLFVTLDDKGDVTLINRKGCEILGYEEAEILGKNWFEHFLPASTKEDARAVFEKLMTGEMERIENHENGILTKDGRERTITWMNTILADDKGNIIGTLSSGEDITDRKLAEEQFERIFNMSLDMICVADINSATFIKVNPAFIDILGYSEEALLGHSFLDFIHPDDIESTVEVAEQVLKKGRNVHRFENRYRTANGEYRWIEWNSHPVPKEGLTYAIGHDITETKQAEKELRNSEHKLFEAQRLAHVGSWDWDVRSGDVEWTDEVFRIFGLDPEQFQPQIDSIMSRFHPDDQKHRALIERAIENRETYSFDARILIPDGTVRDVVTTSRGRYDDEGRLTRIVGTVHDITERKQAEEALARVAKEWQTTFDSVKDVIWILDRDHQILRSNKAAERLTQQPVEAIKGKPCYEIFHGGEESIPECPVRRAKKSLKRETMELNRDEVWYQVMVDPILDVENQYAGAVHIITDITERKNAENALKESEYNLLEAQRITHIGSWAWNQETGEVKCSDEMLRIWGYTLETDRLTIRKIMGRIHPEDRDRVKRALARAAEKDTRYDIEFRIALPGGEERAIHGLGQVDRDKEGRPLVMRGTGQDITEQKRAEEKLRQTRERYALVIDGINDGIWDWDVLTGEVYFSTRWKSMIGYEDHEISGRLSEWESRLHPEDRDRAKERIQAYFDGITEEYKFEHRLRHKDGSYRWILARGVCIRDGQGNPIRMTGSHTEITRQKETEVQFQQAQKLESIGRLAGGVAHDFNNILCVILGYGEGLVEQLHHRDPLRQDAEQIVEAAQRSADLTRQLLAFSRKQALQPRVLDFNTVVRNIETMLCRLIGDDVELVLALSENLARVMADPGQIEQVIMNLVVNACDAMPQGGKLTIETANVELDEETTWDHTGVTPGKFVMLAISDTGAGMDKETLDHVFEPFFTTKAAGKGTGLGLSMVYGIVKQSKGNIWAYSEPGQGTTFKIYLPHTEAEAQEREDRAGAKNLKAGGELILVVEDEESLRTLMTRMLSKFGYQVSVAANGGEALLLVEEEGLTPDLVITDVVMPGMGGSLLVERLRKTYPDLRVLYMSGYTDDAIVHHGVLDADTPFIQKPFNINDIVSKVQEVLKGEGPTGT